MQTVTLRAFLSPFYFALLCVICLLDDSDIAVLSLLSAFLHETAHLAAGFAVGQKKSEYMFRLPVMSIENNGFCTDYISQAVIAASGPLANLLLSVIMKPFSIAASMINFALFALNMLPVTTLDGGQMLFCLLSQWKNPLLAARITTALSYMVIIPLLFCGAALWIHTGSNFSLLAVGVYLLFSQIGAGKR